jgi:hypothetical protein
MLNMDRLYEIASAFAIDDIADIAGFHEKGNINRDAFLVRRHPGGHENEFLLQRLNTDVFTRPERVVRSVSAWVAAQRSYLAKNSHITDWEPIELVPNRTEGDWTILHGELGLEYWRLMKKIPHCRSFKSLAATGEREEQLRIAEEMGRGLALNSDLTSDLHPDDVEIALLGYRNTPLYVAQYEAIVSGNAEPYLPQDPELRSATESLFYNVLPEGERMRRLNDPALHEWFELIDENLDFAQSLYNDVESGGIRRTAIHGDTKIENFLFCQYTGRVRSLVDLDTIMPYTWLADWGDMVRSLCNVAGEKEADLSKVVVDREVYAAVTRGFLSTTEACPLEEIKRMPDAVAIITFELGLRFLTDYLRGDNYFQLAEDDPANLNLIRGLAQLKLFRELCACREWAMDLIVEHQKV